MRPLRQVCSLVALSLFISLPAIAEDLGELPILSVGDITNIIEDRCPCADIPETQDEEDREETSPLDEIEDLSNRLCRSRIANPGKYKQGMRFLVNLGIVELEEGETIRDIFASFKETRRDCRGNKGKSQRR